jgi:hypothetical protein
MGQNGLEELFGVSLEVARAEQDSADVDRQDPFEQIAFRAIDEGYLDFVDQFNRFMEICLRRSA